MAGGRLLTTFAKPAGVSLASLGYSPSASEPLARLPPKLSENKISPEGLLLFSGDSGGSRTRDFLDENQTS